MNHERLRNKPFRAWTKNEVYLAAASVPDLLDEIERLHTERDVLRMEVRQFRFERGDYDATISAGLAEGSTAPTVEKEQT